MARLAVERRHKQQPDWESEISSSLTIHPNQLGGDQAALNTTNHAAANTSIHITDGSTLACSSPILSSSNSSWDRNKKVIRIEQLEQACGSAGRASA